MKKLKKSLAVLLSFMMLLSLMIVSPVGVSAVDTGSSLPGNFVLVHDKGDIGTFDANGELTYTATADDYVWIRNYDTGVQYCTDGWQGFVNSATLVNEKATKQFNKLYVSKGTHTLKAVYNSDDTFTLSYDEGQPSTTAQKPTTPTTPDSTQSGTLSGKFVLVHNTGDIGYFDESGKITYTATETDYVWVRNYDTGVQYCTDGWQGFVDTVTLVNEKTTKQFNKLCVPEGEHTLTLIDNGDDTFTLTYGDETPTTTDNTEPSETRPPTLPSSEVTEPSVTETKPTEVTTPKPGTLSGKFVLVHNTGDIGYFDESGKITYTATETDYVWVRNYDTGVQYCTDGWQGFVDTVILVNEKTTSQFNKLCVPEGEHTLTLIDNGNDTFTLTYGDETPTTKDNTEPSETRPPTLPSSEVTKPSTQQSTTVPDVTETKTMFVGDKDTSASALYDTYSKMFTITADSTDTSVATIVIDSKAENSVTLSALKIGETIITVYTNGAVYQRYKLVVKEKTPGTLSGKFVLVHNTGDIGYFDESGKITYTATETDYVWVRNYDTGVQYCTDGWQGFVDTVTLVNEKATSQFNKLCVPEGEHTLTLIDNGDDTFTLSYGDIVPSTTEPTTEPITTNPTDPTKPTEPVDDSKLNLFVLGDSISAGYGISNSDDMYANIVASEKGYNLENLAVSGHASADLLRLVKEDSKVKSGVEKADIISVSIGGNDLLHNLNEVITNLTLYGAESEYVKNIIENLNVNLNNIVAEIRKLNPDAVIILQTVYNPLAIKNVYGMAVPPTFAQVYAVFNQAFISTSQLNENVYVADVYTAFANDFAENNDPDIIQADGIHPSVSGHKIISDVLLSEINELIAMGVINEKKDTTSYIVGDANGDGMVDIKDASVIQRYTVRIEDLKDTKLLAADADGNGKVTIQDATLIQKFLAGIDIESEIGQTKTV